MLLLLLVASTSVMQDMNESNGLADSRGLGWWVSFCIRQGKGKKGRVR